MLRRWVLPPITAVAAAFLVVGGFWVLPVKKDGLSARRAVVLDSALAHASEEKIARDERAWLGEHYPGAGFIIQALKGQRGWIYSTYTLDTPAGEKEIWFYTGMRDE